MKVFIINCETGCTCCSSDNHSLGFYETREDADRRVGFFLDPNAKHNPVASQYAPKGRYHINEEEAEPISGDRIIVGDRVYEFSKFAQVGPDGSCSGHEVEIWG